MTLPLDKLAPGPDYPLEVTAPDIGPYVGNTELPYVTTFDGDDPGPHVAIAAVVHGNEPCGAIALDWLLRRGVRPRRGRLSLVFVNTAAYWRFDPKNPSASRWVDEDANRLWDATSLAEPATTIERQRTQELRPWLDTVDLLLDLHSMQHATEPLTLAGMLPRSVELARAVGVPATIVCDRGHAAGRRMRDYGQFAGSDSTATALLVECGQHWAQASVDVAIETTVRFLRVSGAVAVNFADDAVPISQPAEAQRIIDVTDAITIRTPNFRFTDRFLGMERIPNAGTVIADDGGTPVKTPYDDCVLIMPSRRLWPGQTAVRLGRERGT